MPGPLGMVRLAALREKSREADSVLLPVNADPGMAMFQYIQQQGALGHRFVVLCVEGVQLDLTCGRRGPVGWYGLIDPRRTACRPKSEGIKTKC